jgi:hypothetical protein
VIKALHHYDYHYGDTFKVEVPFGSGNWLTLRQAADELCQRLSSIFLKDPSNSKRPVFGGQHYFNNDPHWCNYVLFYEYFHGENGAGIGASHQTGWTALIAHMLQGTEQ